MKVKHRPRANPRKHPARYSDQIVHMIAGLIPDESHIHDPFAGTGEFLGRVADRLRCQFTGTEIEPAFIVDQRVTVGDATDPATYPEPGYILVTSPVYPNGVADHFSAKDSSKRNTYRQAVATLEGADRELHPNNMGRYGYRGTGMMSGKRAMYWDLAQAAVANWSGASMVLLNVSDFRFTVKGVEQVEQVVAGWKWTLENNGWRIVAEFPVPTPRYRNGSDRSRDQRVEHEVVMVAKRS